MKKTIILLFLIIFLFSKINTTTVQYYDANDYSNHITLPLDNSFIGDNMDIRRWDSYSYIEFSGYDGTYDPYGAVPAIINDCDISGYYCDYDMIEYCIEYAIETIWGQIDIGSLIDFNVDSDGDGEIKIDFEPSDSYWLSHYGDINKAAIGGPTHEGGNIIIGAYIRINATPTFLDNYTWDASTYQDNDESDVVYLFRTIMHEAMHTLGIGHISSDVTAVMNSDGAPGPSYWVDELTSYDLLAFNKLYNPSACSINDDNIVYHMTTLQKNYPNPFNPTTTILYNLSNNAKNPQIVIYNLKGQKVKTFILEEKTGENKVVWNGRNEHGEKVSSGVSLYTLINKGKKVQTKKMVLLK